MGVNKAVTSKNFTCPNKLNRNTYQTHNQIINPQGTDSKHKFGKTQNNFNSKSLTVRSQNP